MCEMYVCMLIQYRRNAEAPVSSLLRFASTPRIQICTRDLNSRSAYKVSYTGARGRGMARFKWPLYTEAAWLCARVRLRLSACKCAAVRDDEDGFFRSSPLPYSPRATTWTRAARCRRFATI